MLVRTQQLWILRMCLKSCLYKNLDLYGTHVHLQCGGACHDLSNSSSLGSPPSGGHCIRVTANERSPRWYLA